MKFPGRLFRVLVVLWAGSLWSVAWVTQILFRMQPDRPLAGLIAGRLFSIETYLSVCAAAFGLILPGRARRLGAYAGAALLAGNEWLLRPVMVQARLHGGAWGLSFGAWHGVSAVLYILACCAVLLFVWNDDFR